MHPQKALKRAFPLPIGPPVLLPYAIPSHNPTHETMFPDRLKNTIRFSDALEAAGDADLRWRCTLLIAVSLAVGDKGDAAAASAKGALGLQNAEAFAQRERETAEAAYGVLNEVGSAAVIQIAYYVARLPLLLMLDTFHTRVTLCLLRPVDLCKRIRRWTKNNENSNYVCVRCGAVGCGGQAKERVAKAQVMIRRIEEAGSRAADGSLLGDGESEGEMCCCFCCCCCRCLSRCCCFRDCVLVASAGVQRRASRVRSWLRPFVASLPFYFICL